MLSKSKIKYIHSLALKKNRRADSVFVAEGWKLVGDLLPCFTCRYLAATEEWYAAHPQFVPYFPADHDLVSEEELQRASLQENPQQVLAIFDQVQDDTPLAEVAPHELCLMLDGVQNPGNLGTIVRLADWFGIRHVYCSPDCADIYNPKTVQATMGALARVFLHYGELPAALERLKDVAAAPVPVYGTFLDGENLYGKSLRPHGVLVMGNEGNGISLQVARYVSERLFIPNYPPGRATSESLNVAIATAVVCAEFRRRSESTLRCFN